MFSRKREMALLDRIAKLEVALGWCDRSPTGAVNHEIMSYRRDYMVELDRLQREELVGCYAKIDRLKAYAEVLEKQIASTADQTL